MGIITYTGKKRDLFYWLRRWLNNIQVNNERFARWICQSIPNSCPFERDIILFGKTLFHLPPLCHFNPVYNELMGLRLKALDYLSQHSQDISKYICS